MSKKAGTPLPTSYNAMPTAVNYAQRGADEDEKTKSLRSMLVQSSLALLMLVALLFVYHEIENDKTMSSAKSSTKSSSSSSKSSSKSSAASTSNPNVLFIYVDDMGYDSIGGNQYDLHGMTPFINSLIDDGLFFNNYYAQESCTPSRTSLMTGRYPVSTGSQYYVVQPAVSWGLSLTETLLPQVLKDFGGYATYGIGKWHLGHHSPDYLPTARGFDQFFGYLTGEIHYWSKLISNYGSYYHDMVYMDESCYYPYTNKSDETKYSTYLYGGKALQVIGQHDFSEKPMFMYLPFQAVHDPFDDLYDWTTGLNTSFIDEGTYNEILDRIPGSTRQQYAFSLHLLDSTIKNIVEKMTEIGQMDNTLLLLASDNGGCYNAGGRNGELRGCKGTLFEGGFKVNAFMYGPSILPTATQGVNYTNMFHVSDWFPTLLGILNIDYTPASGHAFDGIDHSSYIKEWNSNGYYDANGMDGPRQHLVYNIYYNVDAEDFNETSAAFAVRNIRYKLVRTHVDNDYTSWYNYTTALDEDDDISRGTCIESYVNTGTLSTMLFDLWEDPNETTNLYYTCNETSNALAYAAKVELEQYFDDRLPSIAADTYTGETEKAAMTTWKKYDQYILPWERAVTSSLSLCTPTTFFEPSA